MQIRMRGVHERGHAVVGDGGGIEAERGAAAGPQVLRARAHAVAAGAFAEAHAAPGVGHTGRGDDDVVAHVQRVGGEAPVVGDGAVVVTEGGDGIVEGVVVDLRAVQGVGVEAQAGDGGVVDHVVPDPEAV